MGSSTGTMVRSSWDLDWIPILTSEAFPIPIEKACVSVWQLYRSVDSIHYSGHRCVYVTVGTARTAMEEIVLITTIPLYSTHGQ